jgi:hypothetical protein
MSCYLFGRQAFPKQWTDGQSRHRAITFGDKLGERHVTYIGLQLGPKGRIWSKQRSSWQIALLESWHMERMWLGTDSTWGWGGQWALWWETWSSSWLFGKAKWIELNPRAVALCRWQVWRLKTDGLMIVCESENSEVFHRLNCDENKKNS